MLASTARTVPVPAVPGGTGICAPTALTSNPPDTAITNIKNFKRIILFPSNSQRFVIAYLHSGVRLYRGRTLAHVAPHNSAQMSSRNPV